MLAHNISLCAIPLRFHSQVARNVARRAAYGLWIGSTRGRRRCGGRRAGPPWCRCCAAATTRPGAACASRDAPGSGPECLSSDQSVATGCGIESRLVSRMLMPIEAMCMLDCVSWPPRPSFLPFLPFLPAIALHRRVFFAAGAASSRPGLGPGSLTFALLLLLCRCNSGASSTDPLSAPPFRLPSLPSSPVTLEGPRAWDVSASLAGDVLPRC
jgi:hypothetical protein